MVLLDFFNHPVLIIVGLSCQLILRPTGGDPGLDHLQKYFFDSLCFLQWTWPIWNPWKNFPWENCVIKATKNKAKSCSFFDAIQRCSCGPSADWLNIDGRENPVDVSTLVTGRCAAVRFAAPSSSHLHFKSLLSIFGSLRKPKKTKFTPAVSCVYSVYSFSLSLSLSLSLSAWARSRKKNHVRSAQLIQANFPWPAISDIWLGIRTVPVLSVAKESRGASQIAHLPRSARTQAGRCGLTDRRSSVKKLLSFVRLLMFPSLPEEITGHGMLVDCSKLTCFAKVKFGMVPEQWDRRSKLAAVSHRSRTARQSSTWERGTIGRRRRIHTEKTKTITIIDRRIRIHTCTSRRVKVKSTFGGPPCMRRSSASTVLIG